MVLPRAITHLLLLLPNVKMSLYMLPVATHLLLLPNVKKRPNHLPQQQK
jgi:hypothetical protein